MDIPLFQALRLENYTGVISIVGAGGKTTMMFQLALNFAEKKIPVLTTTTTRIFYPTPDQSDHVIISNDIRDITARAAEWLSQHHHITAAKAFDSKTNKLIGFDANVIDRLWRSGLFRWIIVEADGAAGRPVKAPAKHEPVIPSTTTRLIGVVGMKCLGKPLDSQWVHRPEVFAEITGLNIGETIREQNIVKLILHPSGLMKNSPEKSLKFVWLSQADTCGQRASAIAISEKIHLNTLQQIDAVLIGDVRVCSVWVFVRP